MTETASGIFQSTGRKPGDMLVQSVRRLAPAALTRRTHPAGSATDPAEARGRPRITANSSPKPFRPRFRGIRPSAFAPALVR